MTDKNGRNDLQTLYGALLGGLIATLAGILVFGRFLNASGPVGDEAPIYAMFTGLACVVVFMIGGVVFKERATWLARTLLFASGFTGIWTAALSISVEPRWISATAYGVVIAVGIGLGAWRFRPNGTTAAPAGSEVTWTH